MLLPPGMSPPPGMQMPPGMSPPPGLAMSPGLTWQSGVGVPKLELLPPLAEEEEKKRPRAETGGSEASTMAPSSTGSPSLSPSQHFTPKDSDVVYETDENVYSLSELMNCRFATMRADEDLYRTMPVRDVANLSKTKQPKSPSKSKEWRPTGAQARTRGRAQTSPPDAKWR